MLLIVTCPGPCVGVAEAPKGGGDGQPAVRQLGPRQLRLVQPRMQRGRIQHLTVSLLSCEELLTNIFTVYSMTGLCASATTWATSRC